MSREETRQIIVNFLSQFGARRIGIFGSFARGEENEQSDIDLLVSFEPTPGLLKLVRIQRELSALLGRSVDLVTEGGLKNERLRNFILKDLELLKAH